MTQTNYIGSPKSQLCCDEKNTSTLTLVTYPLFWTCHVLSIGLGTVMLQLKTLSSRCSIENADKPQAMKEGLWWVKFRAAQEHGATCQILSREVVDTGFLEELTFRLRPAGKKEYARQTGAGGGGEMGVVRQKDQRRLKRLSEQDSCDLSSLFLPHTLPTSKN